MSEEKNQIVAFNPEACELSLIAKELKSGATTYQPMKRKAFALTAAAVGLKGRALKRAHWDYMQKCAVSIAKDQAAKLAAGEIVPVRARVSKDGQTADVRYETADHFNRHAVEESKRAPKQMTEDDALAMIAKARGITVEDLKASLELASAK